MQARMHIIATGNDIEFLTGREPHCCKPGINYQRT